MAKEILDKAPEKYKTVCRRCGAKFSYELTDVTKSQMGLRDEVVCPSCGETCWHIAPMKW